MDSSSREGSALDGSFTEEERRLILLGLGHCLDVPPKINLIKFRDVANFESIDEAARAWDDIESKFDISATEVADGTEELGDDSLDSSTTAGPSASSIAARKLADDLLLGIELIRWSPQDTLHAAMQKVYILALKSMVKVERGLGTTKISASKADSDLVGAIESNDDCFISMLDWFENLLCRAGLENFRRHVFDLAHARILAEASHDMAQYSAGVDGLTKSMRDTISAYHHFRNRRIKFGQDLLAYLQSMMSFCNQYKELKKKMKDVDSAERAYIMAYKPEDPDWKIAQGVGVMTFAWRWLVEETHGPMNDKEMKSTMVKMRDDIYVRRRVGAVKTGIKALKGPKSSFNAFIHTVNVLMGSRLRAVFAKGTDALRRKSLDSNAVVETMREGFSEILKNSMIGAEPVMTEFLHNIETGKIAINDDGDDDQDWARADDLDGRSAASITPTQSSIGDEECLYDDLSDQSYVRSATTLGMFSKRGLQSDNDDQHELPFMVKKQKVSSEGAKKHQGLTDDLKKDPKHPSKRGSKEDKENETFA